MSENTVTVELDLAYDTTMDEALARLASEYSVVVSVLQESGPGGGWPEVSVTGSVDKVIAALIEAWGMGAQEALYVLGYDPGDDAVLDA